MIKAQTNSDFMLIEKPYDKKSAGLPPFLPCVQVPNHGNQPVRGDVSPTDLNELLQNYSDF